MLFVFSMPVIQIKPSAREASSPLLEHVKLGGKRTGFKRTRQKQSSAQDDDHCVANFPKAMKDPNWRQKSSESFSRPQSTTSENDHPALSRLPIRNKAQAIRGDKQDIKDTKAVIPKVVAKNDRNGSFENPSSSSCKLIKNLNLSTKSALDTPLHLIEVVVVDDADGSDDLNNPATHDLLDIRQMDMEVAPKGILTPSNTKHVDWRHSDSMDSAPTFYKVPHNSTEDLLEFDHNDSRDDEISAEWQHQNHAHGHEDNTRYQAGQLFKQTTPYAPLSSMESREVAFKKLIQKLQMSAKNGSEDPDSRGTRDSGYSSTFGRKAGEQAIKPHGIGRTPISGSGRRNATLSDYPVPYGYRNNVLHTESGDEEPDTGVDAVAKFNSLNPRAREFLSFANNQSLCNTDSTMEDDDESVRMHSTRKTPNETTIPLFTEPSSQLDPTQVGCDLSPLPLLNFDAVANVNNSCFQSNQVPKSNNSIMPALPLSLPGMAHVIVPTLNGLQLLPLTYLPALAPTTGAAGIHALANTSLGPNLNKMQPIPKATPAPTPAPAAATTTETAPAHSSTAVPAPGSARPRPVPKPKVPNAMGQQAYEAWIEWRKANEPGYAQECKMRQQRRSQRSKMSHPTKSTVVSAA